MAANKITSSAAQSDFLAKLYPISEQGPGGGMVIRYFERVSAASASSECMTEDKEDVCEFYRVVSRLDASDKEYINKWKNGYFRRDTNIRGILHV